MYKRIGVLLQQTRFPLWTNQQFQGISDTSNVLQMLVLLKNPTLLIPKCTSELIDYFLCLNTDEYCLNVWNYNSIGVPLHNHSHYLINVTLPPIQLQDLHLAQPDRNNTAFYDSILGCRISISFRGLISHKYQQSTFLNKTITKKCSCPFVPLVTIESKAELFTDSLFEELRHNTRLNKLICSNISNCLFQSHLHVSTTSVKIVW